MEEIYLSKLLISIDGPSGSGKEKIAEYIAKKYKLYHLDSGVLYRRVAAKLLKNKIDISSKKEIKNFLKSIKSLSYKKNKNLRTEKLSKISSQIAVIPLIRKFINNQQHQIVSKLLVNYKGCVIDGRDIGSNVFKNAKIKLFITSNLQIRAKRRHKQLIELGEKSIYSQILKDLKLRDKNDKSRKISPLIVPDKAIIINNSKSFKKTTIQIDSILENIYTN